MRKITKKLISSILICACCITGFPAKTYASSGNDTFSTATQITSTSAISSQLDDKNDVDWYKYTVDVSGHFNIELTSNENTDNYSLNVYNSNLQDLGIELEWGEMKAVSQTYAYKEGTVLYIKVSQRPYYGDAAGKTYGLNINATSASDWEIEENDTKVEANTITANEKKYANLQSGEDKDVFAFQFPSDGSVKFTLQNEDAVNAKWCLKVLDSSFNEIRTIDNDPENYSLTSRRYNYKKDEILYIEIRMLEYDHGAKKLLYSLLPVFTSSKNWETEDNDTIKNANSLTLGKAKNGTIYQLPDEDYYVFKAKKNGTVKFSFSIGEGVLYDGKEAEVGYDIEVLNGSNKSLKSASNIFAGKSLSFKVKKGKKYYIHVGSRSKGGFLADTGPCDARYSVKVKYKSTQSGHKSKKSDSFIVM